MHAQQISIVIPVYNEVDNIIPLVDEIREAMNGKMEYEIIFADDGSNDSTDTKIAAMMVKYPEVKTVRHRRNYGQSTSIVSGVKAARYPWIVTLDGDRQNDPHDIVLLVDTLGAQNDAAKFGYVILGLRAQRHDNWLRRVSSKWANGVRQFLLRDDCTDTGCSLKLFPKEAFLKIPHFNHCHRFLPALFKRQGLQAVSVAVNHRARVSGQSKYGFLNRFWVGIVDLGGVMWLMRRPCQAELDNDRIDAS